jgi:hypothetical protein
MLAVELIANPSGVGGVGMEQHHVDAVQVNRLMCLAGAAVLGCHPGCRHQSGADPALQHTYEQTGRGMHSTRDPRVGLYAKMNFVASLQALTLLATDCHYGRSWRASRPTQIRAS